MYKIKKLSYATATLCALSLVGISWQGMAAATGKDKGGAVWGANYFPNIELTSHEGRTYKFFDDLIEGKVVAINFIYTSCPDVCPLETARMKEVYHLLEERVGKDVFFYSITIDPETDTPEVLADYVEKFEVPSGWMFLTGNEDDIVLLRRKLGLYIEEIQSADSNDHNLSLIVGNQSTGRWMKRSPFENPYILASQIGGELHNWKLARNNDLSYEKAPELRNISKGESLFRTRCGACHTIGEGEAAARNRSGPDLYNVTRRRDRKWLSRWIAEPDKVIAEKDPIAMAMMAKYNNLAMPNMQLNNYEVEVLLTYIDKESRRIQKYELENPANPVSIAPEHSNHAGHGDYVDHSNHVDHSSHTD